ncbi:MAG: hypothetical protein NTV51_17310 [Verrucomicrobia bacterium]|nr:hypothetical protein [Verrucomicrobiota bacterium]
MRRLPFLLLLAFAPLLRAADPLPPLSPDDPAWSDLVKAFARLSDSTADFAEKRFFPFRKTPLELSGVSRVAPARGLSLDYLVPERRTVILDDRGMLIREAGGESVAPSDPRVSTGNLALVQVLRLDLAALALTFELSGRRMGDNWMLTLVPHTAELRRAIAEIGVTGEAAQVRTIVIRRSAKQSVEITVGPAHPTPFTTEDLQRFFR